MSTTTDYEKQAADFLAKTGATMTIEFKKHGKHFADDKEDRDIYTVTIQRGARKYTFDFGQSIARSGKFIAFTPTGRKLVDTQKDGWRLGASAGEVVPNKEFAEPTAYNVFACLEKHGYDSFEDFCDELGYDADSRKAEKIYNAVMEEYRNVCMLFNEEEMEQLREIQ